tara:strand:- start:63 stop:410 length:348 start_codon:yes stop_codon:yes gene_type:complete
MAVMRQKSTALVMPIASSFSTLVKRICITLALKMVAMITCTALFDKKEDKMNNDYDNLVRYLMTRKGYSKSEARSEAWKCILKKALDHELARNDIDSDEWMSTEELSEFGLKREG